jgi:hypothetical protein
MACMLPGDFHDCEQRLRLVLERIRSQLSQEAVDHVEHLLSHGELEMAYESLGLSIEKESASISPDFAPMIYDLGVALQMDRETVFDAGFWPRFRRLLQPG